MVETVKITRGSASANREQARRHGRFRYTLSLQYAALTPEKEPTSDLMVDEEQRLSVDWGGGRGTRRFAVCINWGIRSMGR